jgi:lysophospholipid acyltransferase (LPLAT)-like uncharacterized protein
MMKRLLRSAVVQGAASWVATFYVVFVARFTRWRIEGEAELAAFAAGGPCIVAFWHETLPSMAIFWLAAKRRGLRRPAVVLASRHRDGRLIGQAVANMGIGVVGGSSARGASAKGGAEALRALVKALARGQHVGLTPDGPRGPRRLAAAGVAQLAALAGVQVLPCAAAVSRGWQLRSWDRMRLPLPFGRGVLVCGPSIAVAREDTVAALAEIEAALTAALRRAEAGL